LAWILATHPDARLRDSAQALQLATRAFELSPPNDAAALDTLAAAYAEAGRFDDAIKSAQRAAELAQADGPKQLLGDIQARLLLYRAGKPYREP